MTPRDNRPRFTAVFTAARSLARSLPVALVLAVPVLAPIGAFAAVTGISVMPAAPATCDSVTLRGEGMISTCFYLASGEVFGPEEIPVAGPVPAYRTRIVFTVRPDSAQVPCITLSLFRYAREFPMGRLPMGHHFVTAVERAYDVSGNLLDSSVVDTSFFVSARDTCPVPACVLVGFAARAFPSKGFVCDAMAAPGGEGCFNITLQNDVPVGGVQLKVQVTDAHGVPVPAGSFTLKSATPGDRAAGFQAASEADGSIILYTASGAVISPGRGPILKVCYDVGMNVPRGLYRLRFERLLVVNPEEVVIPMCPTFAEPNGSFCVGPAEGCDLNGDGIADLRDIIRLVRCALAGDACPDSIANRGDCNGDGSIDIRDVICCVRKLLQLDRGMMMIEPPANQDPTRIGFDGPTSWDSATTGRAEIEVTPAADFGAIDFDIEPAASVRITGARLTNGGGATLEWALRENGVARVLLLRSGNGWSGNQGPTSFRIAVDLEPLPGGAASGTLRLQGGQSATWDAAEAPYVITASSTPVTAPATAPRIEGARPNPFAATTEIPFTLPAPSHVSVRVYDVTGRLVRTLVDATRPAGAGRATWDGRDATGKSAPTGVYFVKLVTPSGERTARMIKMR